MQLRLLKMLIGLAAFVPVLGGGVGVLRGAAAFGSWPGAAADSQTRYLSGLLLGIGLAYWACVPTLERRAREIGLLTVIVLIGGVSRLAGVVLAGDPGPIRWTLAMELLVAPALGLWQLQLARKSGRPG
ncbi:MAG TPA: DUF4345 family protein [Caulobacteraceae bacterium]|jgi:hypothetical protein|nr:DUF4345 family protein [Caulobacteraceae bacterium]